MRIASAVMGSGPPLVKAANWLSHLEFDRTSPVWRHWLGALSATHTLVRYDERGCGLSDWDVQGFSIETWVEDLETVVDGLELDRFPLLGISQGGAVAIAYAVRHPERVTHLVLYGTYAAGWAKRPITKAQREEYEALLTLTRQGWGRDSPAYRQVFTGLFAPDADQEQIQSFNELQRISTSPENAVRFQRAFGDVDVRHLLSEVGVPTLVLHARHDARCPFDEGRRIAAAIPDARFVPLESRNHVLLEGEPAWDRLVEEVRSFLGVGHVPAGVSESRGVLDSLRRKRVPQWALAYVTGAWVALQVLDVLEGPWDLEPATTRAAQLLLAGGLPISLVVAWFHGERDRQRISGLEIVVVLVLVTLVAVALRFV